MNKTAHFYWGENQPLSFMQFMSVVSFAYWNRDWEIIVWRTEKTSKDRLWDSSEHSQSLSDIIDWFPALCEYENVHVQTGETGLKKNCPGLSEIHKSDLLRWKILAEYGGLWSDMDILYHAPVEKAVKGLKQPVLLCKLINGKNQELLPIGCLYADGSEDSRAFFNKVHKLALKQVKANRYQSAGRFVLEKVVEDTDIDIGFIDQSSVYPMYSNKISQVFNKMACPTTEHSIGIHWYAGNGRHSQTQMRVITPETLPKRAEKSILFQRMNNVWDKIQHTVSIPAQD